MTTTAEAPHWADKAGSQTLSDMGLWSREDAILLHLNMGKGHMNG